MREWTQLNELEGELIDSWWASKEDKKLFEEMRIKAEAFDKLQQLEEEWADESMEYIDSVNEGFADYDEVVLSKLDGDFAYGRANVYDLVYLQLKDLER